MKSSTLRIGLWGVLLSALPVPAIASGGASGVQSLDLAATSPTVVAGAPVQFFDRSSDEPTSWEWDFSFEVGVPAVDSREQNPVWTFADAGTWAVRLEACNIAGCGVLVKSVDVVPPCNLAPDLVLSSLVVADAQSFEACHTISAGTGFSIVNPGQAVFRAGRTVAFGDGFSVVAGGSLRVEIDPVLDVP